MAEQLFDKVREMIGAIKESAPTNIEELEQFRIRFLGSKNQLKPLMGEIRNVINERKKEYGQLVNEAKQVAEAKFAELKASLESAAEESAAGEIDLTAPGEPIPLGSRHPISATRNRIVSIFERIGFVVVEGPEIEDDWHNFTAMNTPEDHPARDMQDTYYLKGYTPGSGARLLRTHTSPVQIRSMEATGAPTRIICPGRVYRADYDQTHTPMFHQVEGLAIDKDISMANLKWALEEFVKSYFEVDNVDIRFRASHFPFTEPSAEVDIRCSWEGGTLKVGEGDDWLEILGSGMVHPKVLQAGGIDPTEWQGFAFGMGIDRIAMLKYGIPDLRAFFDSDLRWLRHYGFAALDQPTLHGGLSR